ncbi:MAG: MvaI/BcnI family restriction endonuclease, partial [Lachnospiraceae bacterium]
MIFTPYNDETKVINTIHKYNEGEYALIRITQTMIDKNNTDANGIFREILLNEDLVNYDDLESGGENGVCKKAIFIQNGKIDYVNLKFYLVNNKRGDRRFSVEKIRRKNEDKEIFVGDLLYFSTIRRSRHEVELIMINLTHNIPDEKLLESIIGKDKIAQTLNELYPMIKKIVLDGFHDNSKGEGLISPKDVGDTLEALLGIETNNSPEADYKGIEIKSKVGITLDTLFTLRPSFEGT